MELISSRSNPKIKALRALRDRSPRPESNTLLVEGIFHVGEAAAAARAGKLALQAIYYAPDLLRSEFALGLVQEQSAAGIPCYPLAAEVFSSVAEKDNPQGILAVARLRQYTLDELGALNFPWGVALVAPQDPGNLGTILRSIDAAGASGLLLLEGGVDPYHPAAVRASMGAIFWHPLVRASFKAFAVWAKEEGYTVYGTSAHAALDYRQVHAYPRPLILLLGSEREGLTPEQAAACHTMLRMPMRGRVTSLNLAVAAGVMLYAMLE